ncbi:MAG TPA: CRTAC1 family protein [Candidatus Limnocylindria bacterium]|nr:CRTAC1 family protein [Candidatus Limnocylindria bacterium]
MSTPLLRRYAASLAGLGLVVTAYAFTRYPEISAVESTRMASRFHFSKSPFPEVAQHPPYKNVRAVHPSLSRISAWVSSLGAGVTLADLDGDGLSNDLITVDPRTDLVTVAPVPGTGDRYQPFALTAGALPYDTATTAPMGTLAGDFNEDGLMDVLVYFWGRTPILYLRKAAESQSANGATALGGGQYSATELVTSGERWYSNGAIQADLDGDGHVDLLIGNYFQDGARILDAHGGGVQTMHEGKAKALNGGYKHVFLWRPPTPGAPGSVAYAEQTSVFREEVARGWTLAIGAADLDGDGLPEIYFAHDFGPDRLLHNRSTPGHLQFAELEGRRTMTTPKSCVLGYDSFKGMGCDFGDVNGDGLLDIYVSNIATQFGLTESHFLWQSTGETAEMKSGIAPYIQNSERLGLSRSGWGWDCRLVDFDNDSVPEAIQAVGFIKGTINRWPELQSLGTSNSKIIHDPRLWPTFKPGADLSGHDVNPFFVRASDGRYYDVAAEIGLTDPSVSKGIAIADVDGDGRLDFAVANQWETSFYFHNEAPAPGAFIGLHLLLPVAGAPAMTLKERAGHPGADTPGRPAFGAAAQVILPDGRKLVAQVDGGSGHSGRRSPDIHFGLGTLPAGTRIPVALKWRDTQGRMQQSTLDLSPGWHTVQLGSTSGSLAQLQP